MENLVEKLQAIVKEFENIENITPEDLASLKRKEFELFDKIETIKEVCEYYKTDMTLDKMNPQFISGFYSGVINGSMFVISAIGHVIFSKHPENWSVKDMVDTIVDKLELIQGLKLNNNLNNGRQL